MIFIRPGTGTVTVWENLGGTRSSKPIFQLTGIPLTPGPLVVVLKVPNSQIGNGTSRYWPPSLRDSVEAIAASYIQGSSGSKVRLFNLAPGIKSAGMTCSSNGTAQIASGVKYSLGSAWMPVATQAARFGFVDDGAREVATLMFTPATAPIENTIMLMGVQGAGKYDVRAVPLQDAPEGGTCHP